MRDDQGRADQPCGAGIDRQQAGGLRRVGDQRDPAQQAKAGGIGHRREQHDLADGEGRQAGRGVGAVADGAPRQRAEADRVTDGIGRQRRQERPTIRQAGPDVAQHRDLVDRQRQQRKRRECRGQPQAGRRDRGKSACDVSDIDAAQGAVQHHACGDDDDAGHQRRQRTRQVPGKSHRSPRANAGVEYGIGQAVGRRISGDTAAASGPGDRPPAHPPAGSRQTT